MPEACSREHQITIFLSSLDRRPAISIPNKTGTVDYKAYCCRRVVTSALVSPVMDPGAGPGNSAAVSGGVIPSVADNHLLLYLYLDAVGRA